MVEIHALTNEEEQILLKEARHSIELAIQNKPLPELILQDYSPALQEKGASFVTLTEHDELRGCIGALEAYQPLILDVREHAIAAALDDYRFSPVQPDELPFLHIEISRLTNPEPLAYSEPFRLPELLKKGVDGVILRDGIRRATFLPQVWEQLPIPEDFLSHLCNKMGAPADLWRHKKLDVSIYHVVEFHE
jgi:AmmeMemoRadiSam system protein A